MSVLIGLHYVAGVDRRLFDRLMRSVPVTSPLSSK
jgi:hypothetical protein